MEITLETNSSVEPEARAEIDRLMADANAMRREIRDHHERAERSRQRILTMLESIKAQLGAMSRVAKAD